MCFKFYPRAFCEFVLDLKRRKSRYLEVAIHRLFTTESFVQCQPKPRKNASHMAKQCTLVSTVNTSEYFLYCATATQSSIHLSQEIVGGLRMTRTFRRNMYLCTLEGIKKVSTILQEFQFVLSILCSKKFLIYTQHNRTAPRKSLRAFMWQLRK